MKILDWSICLITLAISVERSLEKELNESGTPFVDPKITTRYNKSVSQDQEKAPLFLDLWYKEKNFISLVLLNLILRKYDSQSSINFNGILITPNRILTAATYIQTHAVDVVPEDIFIVEPQPLGGILMNNIKIHKSYNPDEFNDNNIAILSMAESANFSQISPNLPPFSEEPWDKSFVSENCALIYIQRATKKQTFSRFTVSRKQPICACTSDLQEEQNLCGIKTAGEEFDYGWIGSPLVCNNKTVGILHSYVLRDFCQAVRYIPMGSTFTASVVQPMFLYLYYYRDWIGSQSTLYQTSRGTTFRGLIFIPLCVVLFHF